MSAESRFCSALDAYACGELSTAAGLCEQALDGDAPDAALTVRIIHLYLIATEIWWFVNRSEDVGGLVARAQAAAADTGDSALTAMACCMRGRFLVARNGLPDAIEALAEAADLAAGSGNRLAELETLSDLGHHLVGRNMARGLNTLRRAQALAEQTVEDDLPACDRRLLPVFRARLKGLLGVAVFDDGQFDDAESWLRGSLRDLQEIQSWDHRAVISNYLGQLLTEMGRFEEAEAVLLSALEPLRDAADLSTFQGYNLGLLGKLYLEWGRIGDAEASLRAGWRRLGRTQHRAILPILRNYLGELYMHPSYPARDVVYASQMFNETIAESGQSGFQRSEIGALALVARARLALGDLDGAAAASAAATEKLEAAGTMPALRTEEVYLIRYEVLNSLGAQTDAQTYLARAQRVLLRKAATVIDPALRGQFLARVPISAKIMSCCKALALESSPDTA
jgi:tetratricopeptide (TPR) repeat protein